MSGRYAANSGKPQSGATLVEQNQQQLYKVQHTVTDIH